MAANEAIAFYEPGADITGHCDAAVTGRRFVMISADKQPGSVLTPPGADQTSGGNVRITHATAAGRVFGVASHDAAIGMKVAVKRGPGIVLPLRAGAAIDAFEEVEVGAAGVAVPLAAGVAVGYALTAIANGADGPIVLY